MKPIGVGEVTDDRLKRNIQIIVDANKLPRTPAPNEVFDRRFLPPASERLKEVKGRRPGCDLSK